MMVHPRRLLTILVSCIISIEICFLIAAHYHISNSHHQTVNIQGFYRQRGAPSTKQYKPDYTKFNTSHPPILFASYPESLNSLPNVNRIPKHVLQTQNFTQYYANYNADVDGPTLFVYNPSIVQLYSLSASPEVDILDLQYLATFRISSIHSCGFPTYDFWNHPIEYVGIAILSNKLQVATLPNNNNTYDSLDMIIDLNTQLRKIYGRQFTRKQRKRLLQDVRLFQLHDRVYLSVEAWLIPICIQIINEDGVGLSASVNLAESSLAICKQNDSTIEEIPALYKSNDRLKLYVTGDIIHVQGTVTPKGVIGKNFQYFVSTTSDRALQSSGTNVLMEFYPTGPRQLYDLGQEISKAHLPHNVLKNHELKQKTVVDIQKLRDVESNQHPNPISQVSKSLDDTLKSFIKRDRGSACCVVITKSHYEEILPPLPASSISMLKQVNYTFQVGISHSKSRNKMPSSQGDRYNYLSRLYAVSTVEPYEVIARSGLFCFGFPTNEKDTAITSFSSVGNEYIKLTQQKELELNGKTYNCPNIHFIDSIIDKSSDDTKVVVSLGVNDCIPLFVEMSKRDIVIHLFSGDYSSGIR